MERHLNGYIVKDSIYVFLYRFIPRFILYSSRLPYSILYLSVPVRVRVCVFVYSCVFSFVILCVHSLLFYFHPDFSFIHIPPLIICPFRQSVLFKILPFIIYLLYYIYRQYFKVFYCSITNVCRNIIDI